jgi:hypothetical protein
MTDKPDATTTPEGADPSMEDILASIRRILNEEETPSAPGARDDSPAGGDTHADDDDVLVLDPSMMVSAASPAHDGSEPEANAQPEIAQPEIAQPEIVQPAPHAEPAVLNPVLPNPEVMTSSPQAAPSELPPPTSELVAPEAAAAAAFSVGSLVRTLAAGRATQVYTGGPTLEDMVRAELRPLLKEWLDANLPPLVERLVRTEIERVVGRAVP